MKTLQFSRTLALTGLALSPVGWLVSGCGGGGGGGSNNGGNATPVATRTPTATRTATASPTVTATGSATPISSATPVGTVTASPTRTPTPIPTPVVPSGGQRFLASVDLGRGQISELNLVITRFGSINGLITVPRIPNDKVGIYLIQPGTYAVTGSFSFPNNFNFAGTLRTVGGTSLPFVAVGTSASGGNPGRITVTVGNTTFPTQNF